MRVLKVVAAILVTVLAVAGGFAVYVHLSGIPHYDRVGVPDLHVEATPERVARGKRWAQMLCGDCHGNPSTGRLTGSDMRIDDPFGNIHSLNITRHPERGIGAWSDGDIAFLLRTGIARDGRYTPPWMVKLVNMGDEDLLSIIAFLRSDDPMVAASDTPNVPSHPSFFAKFLTHVAFKPYPFPAQPITAPAEGDIVGRGRYLAWNLDCWACHSPDFSTINPRDPPTTPGYVSGGNPIDNAAGEKINSANLTPDPETGIGKWSEADFVRTLREGVRPDNTAVRAPMNTYSLLTVAEAGAIFAYLKTIPAIRHPVTRSPGPVVTPETAAGKRAFTRYACYSCHGNEGIGNCDLTHNTEHWPADADLAAFIRDPSSRLPGSRMPAWRSIIPDDELQQLIAHLRTLARPAAAPAH